MARGAAAGRASFRFSGFLFVFGYPAGQFRLPRVTFGRFRAALMGKNKINKNNEVSSSSRLARNLNA